MFAFRCRCRNCCVRGRLTSKSLQNDGDRSCTWRARRPRLPLNTRRALRVALRASLAPFYIDRSRVTIWQHVNRAVQCPGTGRRPPPVLPGPAGTCRGHRVSVVIAEQCKSAVPTVQQEQQHCKITMPDIEQDIKKVVITFFAPPLKDKDSSNEGLRKKVKNSGRFDQGGTMFRTREIYDTYRYGGAFPMFHYQDDPKIVQSLEDDTSKMFPKFALGDGVQSRQGIYHEVARKRLPAYDPDCTIEDLSYITLAYKSLEPDPNQKLLDNWKSWTGARAILEDFGDKVPIQEVIFLARQFPDDFDVFAYIVLLSFRTSQEARSWVLYYVQRLRVERWFGYSTLYAAAPSYRRHVGSASDN